MSEEVKKIELSENELIAQRKAKLDALREKGIAYPNDFRRDAYSGELHKQYDEEPTEVLAEKKIRVTVAGRIMLCRVMGKASFVQIQDMDGRIQCYLRNDDLPEGQYDEFKDWDLGDIIGVEGYIFKTKTGELTIHAEKIRLLTKALRPLPDKFHGLTDREVCYRQRYIDLIANPESKKVFETRIKIIECIRQFMRDRHFQEVETPIMHVIPGGASARPFITHHNALDMDLYLRIAPELYLKRLVVGGFERVFEINRSFRNEGISTQHNPEFTMIEFYQAYADYKDLMNLTEELLKTIAECVLGRTTAEFQGITFDFSKPFEKISLRDSILKFNPDLTAEDIDTKEAATKIAEKMKIELMPNWGLGHIQTLIFDETVEPNLLQPTFITEYPAEVSPLARRNDENPFVTDRFEFFMAGKEIANGFSELNDPEDQASRFRHQVIEKEAGDDEAMHYDADYITALEYGLPPTAGEGIGIDRLTMMLTDSSSIRDVLLFPHMRFDLP